MNASQIIRILHQKLNYALLSKTTNGKRGKDRPITSGWVTPEKLLAHTCDCRPDIMRTLSSAGLEDPLETTEAMKKHVIFHLAQLRQEPGTLEPGQQEKAIRIMQSILPRNTTFQLDGQRYGGIPSENGGLEIEYIDNFAAETDTLSALRRQHGNLLPKLIMDNNEPGNCAELSCLLIALLRCAGIKALIYIDITSLERHGRLVATLDNKRFMLDPAKRKFYATDEQGQPDSFALSAHLNNIFVFFAALSIDNPILDVVDLILPLY